MLDAEELGRRRVKLQNLSNFMAELCTLRYRRNLIKLKKTNPDKEIPSLNILDNASLFTYYADIDPYFKNRIKEKLILMTAAGEGEDYESIINNYSDFINNVENCIWYFYPEDSDEQERKSIFAELEKNDPIYLPKFNCLNNPLGEYINLNHLNRSLLASQNNQASIGQKKLKNSDKTNYKNNIGVGIKRKSCEFGKGFSLYRRSDYSGRVRRGETKANYSYKGFDPEDYYEEIFKLILEWEKTNPNINKKHKTFYMRLTESGLKITTSPKPNDEDQSLCEDINANNITFAN